MNYLKTVTRIIRQLKPELVREYNVAHIGLFGSIVRDDFSFEKSDIDIIVDFSKPVGIEFVDLAEYLERKLSRKVDLVSRKGIKGRYLTEIESEVVYV
ncbi:MAG: nucleotidyltransferase family protein [Bacteroidia bacterium]|nr:nucleotidyltransferase family protein [Bacteroidia bacterium]